ncbi:MAG: MiaB/RimO family radical SAM methylthiotransferase [Planctomycetota bacterium]|jgi:threonylcarbamoyladenosine tRNA methylthiotransferase MtaB
MKVYIKTLGCRTNQFDAAALLENFTIAGYGAAADPKAAHVIIVNTCTVTGRADAKCRQAVRRLVRENPRARLAVAGCGPVVRAQAFRAIQGVEAVFGVNAGPDIMAWLGLPGARGNPAFGVISGFGGRARAHIKIQEGCDAFCSYCIVPFVRGKPVSRPFDEVCDQARRLVDKGFQEIVLTGIHTGRYCHEGRDLTALVSALAGLPGAFRVRLSSIEPNEVTPGLLNLILDHPKVCNHLHISLQSGDDAVLARMNRQYRARDFFGLVEEIRGRDPACGLGTDIIAGFNGETKAEFRNTLSSVKASPLTYGHVFPFSLRRGTRAESLPGPVPAPEKNRRVTALKKAFAGLKRRFAASLKGRTLYTVFEKGGEGLTSNYMRVRAAPAAPAGTLAAVRIRGPGRGLLRGKCV